MLKLTMWKKISRKIFPQGLYWRAILILLMPLFLLQGVLAYVFMERHFEKVTRSLSSGFSNTVAAIIAIDEDTNGSQRELLEKIGNSQLNLTVKFNELVKFPPSTKITDDDFLGKVLSVELSRRFAHRFWLDTYSRFNIVDLFIELQDKSILHITARRSQTYASNAHVFLVWMVGTAFLLAGVAILFLRNQIRPIESLAIAAEAFGRGQTVEQFSPRGAKEVRRAANAFIRMKARLEKQREQRTNMFNGISHDLRTVLTRFQLQLSLLPHSTDVSSDIKALEGDTQDMQKMVEAYLAFARGDSGEIAEYIEISEFLTKIVEETARSGFNVTLPPCPQIHVHMRPNAMKRCIHNLLTNATRFAKHVEIRLEQTETDIFIHIDDNGKGVDPSKFSEVMRPFYKIEGFESALNGAPNEGGSGLGLAIAQDIATSHGGELTLSQSPLGGLRASVRIPI